MLVQPNGLMVIVLEHILPIDIPWYSHLLVGGAIAILKHMQVNGKDYPIYRVENIGKMFETTNQIGFCWKNFPYLWDDDAGKIDCCMETIVG
jgi:hypothetical protein